jgi:hypothetical protein
MLTHKLVQQWVDWDVEAPARLSGRRTLTSLRSWNNHTRPSSGNYHWITEFLCTLSIAHPHKRHDYFLWLGVDIIKFESRWFIPALEDYHQFWWALHLVNGWWPEVNAWHQEFLWRPLLHIEPRSLYLVFESMGYPMYISLHYHCKNKLKNSYALWFADDNTMVSLVRGLVISVVRNTDCPPQETLCELCAKAGLYWCMKGKQMSDKAVDKCPICICAERGRRWLMGTFI